jgi:hypothetical protein
MANGIPFNEQELEVINDTTLTHTQAAKEISRSVNSVYGKRHQLGLIDKCKGHRRKWTGLELKEILAPQKPLDKLAVEFKRSKSSIYQMRHELKVA